MTADVTVILLLMRILYLEVQLYSMVKVMVTVLGMKTMMGAMAEDMADDEVDSPLKVKLTACRANSNV